MHPYEVVILLNPSIEGDEEVDAQLTRFVDIIVQGNGELENVDKWGKRNLAYEINGHTEAYYAVINFRAPSEATAELEHHLKISDEVVRHLLIRKSA